MRRDGAQATATAAGAAFLVEDVQRFGAFVTHIGRVTAGELKPGDAVQLCVDYGRRAPIAQVSLGSSWITRSSTVSTRGCVHVRSRGW